MREAVERFDAWLEVSLTNEMSGLSDKHREEFVEPVSHVSRQLAQSLQDFRNRLSERTLAALGVPLQTSEADLPPGAPRTPDVRVGKIFDRNWELLSAVVPMTLVKGAVSRHFERKTADSVVVNISRLVSQWEESVRAALFALQREAQHRFDELIATIGRLIAAAADEAPQIRAGLDRLAALRASIRR